MTVRLVRTIAACRRAVADARAGDATVGFVPTMGSLHEGHLALIDRARERCDVSVLSIFVNPLQFGPTEDFDRYPRDLPRDLEVAGERGADLVFAPSTEEMAPRPLVSRITMSAVVEGFEGAARPGHFDGVLTIVAKLLHVIEPDVAVFGRKDAQQAAAVRRMVADLDLPVAIEVVPTVRDPDGLALSSRNAHLSADERARALEIHRALRLGRQAVAAGERTAAGVDAVVGGSLARIPGLDVDYTAVVDGDTFDPVETIGPGALAIVAAVVGSTRLIDNLLLWSDEG